MKKMLILVLAVIFINSVFAASVGVEGDFTENRVIYIPPADAIDYNATINVNSSNYWDDLDTPADFLLSMFDGPNWIDKDLDLRWQDLLQIDEMWANTGYFTDIEITSIAVEDWSNLTDVLNLSFVPYTGATDNVDLGNWNITTTGTVTTTNLNVEENVTADWFKGKWNGTSLDDWIIMDGASVDFNESNLDSIYHNATEGSAIVGTIDGGTLADTQHQDALYDGITFNFSEEVGTPGLDMRMNFTGLTVETFSRGIMRYKTSALSGDYPLVQMWNYDDSVWEDYPQLIESDTFATMTQPVFDGASHIQDGVTQMRIYKAGAGKTQNHYYVDWIAIVSGIGLPIGQEIDPIFNRWLHNASLESNLNGTGYNISASHVTLESTTSPLMTFKYNDTNYGTIGVNNVGVLTFNSVSSAGQAKVEFAERTLISGQSGNSLWLNRAPNAVSYTYPLIMMGTSSSDARFRAGGTYIGIESAAAFVGDYFHFVDDGVSVAKMDYAGNLITTGSVTTTHLNVTGNITLQNGGKLWDNSTCTFLASPDGSTITEVCNA